MKPQGWCWEERSWILSELMEFGCSTLLVVHFFLLTMKGVELIHLSSKTLWEEVSSTNDAGRSLMSNHSTAFANTLLSHTDSWNNWLERCSIIFDWRWRTKIMRALTWIGQCIWSFNNLYITIDSTNISSCIDSIFSVVVKECDGICHLGRNEWVKFITVLQCLHVI